ncbi:ketopantoate reductase family protein [Ferrimonas balearica]|uniref:ketopantoate reductase family protein n=1 Tax=Ferrimonas balearica TaxID=44012 RepID=UPI001C57F955|nr:2-dehydropantoate 2-reductase [Ferrimonas balearica]MBW3164449.1 2-dehydropantoate 2-reductase [Ferrimonas balearica]
MTVGVLGAGALGQLLAHQLAAASLPVTLLRRPGTTDSQISHTLYPLDGPEQRRSLTHVASDTPHPLSLVLVLTKAQDCLNALVPLLSGLPESVPVVLLHNGLGPQQAAAERWPQRPWWAGSLSDGALALNPYSVRHTGQGTRRAGPLSASAQAMAMPAPLAQLGFEYDAEVMTTLWQKLTVNLLINPLTARDRVTNGTLLNPDYLATLRQLADETAAVGQASGHADSPAAILDRALSVASATANNRSSMLQDIEAGRPTELDAITGYLLQQARRYGIPCPGHQALYQQLQG